MSILDTFFILFETNAKEAEKGVDDLGDATEATAKKMEKIDSGAKALKSSLIELAKGMAAPLLALTSVGGVVSAVTGRMAQIREIDNFSAKLNSSIESVDAFRRSVVAIGGDSAAALDSLVKVGEKVNEAFSDAGGAAAEDFKKWGVAFKDAEGQALGATEATLNLAKSLEGVSRAEALARLKTLGIEDATSINLLLKGRAALEDQMRAQQKLGGITKESAENTRLFFDQVARAQGNVQSWAAALLDTLIPAFTTGMRVLADATQWISDNQSLVEGFFVGVAGVITAVYLPAMLRVAAATIAATWPFLAIGAAIAAVGAAFALAYEDVKAFMNGQPSLIGELYAKYEWFKSIVDVVIVAVKAIGEAINWVWGIASDFFAGVPDDLSAMVEGFKRSAQGIKDAIGGAFTWIKDQWDRFIAPIFDKIGAVMDYVRGASTPEDLAAQGSGTVYDGSVGYNQPGALPTPRADARAQMDATFEAANQGVTAGQAAIAAANANPFNGSTPSSIQMGAQTEVNRTTTVTIGDVNVTTAATDPRATGAAVRAELEKYLRDTTSQLDDGVRN